MKKPRITIAERLQIECLLCQGKNFYKIGQILNRPARTIMREVTAHAIASDKVAPGRIRNRCVLRYVCEKRHICQQCFSPGTYKTSIKTRLCRFCAKCNENCSDFIEDKCEKLLKPPYVCNGCADERKCQLRKKFYIASKSNEQYRTLLVESRKGANISEEELLVIDTHLSHFTKNGQSIHAAVVAHPEAFNLNEKTLYRYVNGGLLNATKRGDLPRACMIKPRKSKPIEHKIDSKCRINRTYQDYLNYMAQYPGCPIVEMDTVEGVKGGKVLLTLMFMPSRFMVAYLLDEKTSANVTNVFHKLYRSITSVIGNEMTIEMFASLFPLILTDNGSEFSNPLAIELDNEGNILTKVFYCEPNSPYQKAFVERNHEHIRKILPKGTTYLETTSFDNLTQEQINLMMSHINSYPRQVLKDQIPYDLFAKTFGESLARDLFGIKKINADDIVLHPRLLGIEQKVKASMLK